MGVTDKSIYTDDYVTLEPKQHIYTDKDNRQYQSTSNLLKLMEIPFDKDGISSAMARSRAGKGATPEMIAREKKSILNEWDRKRDNSTSYGTAIHDGLEKYFETGSSGTPAIDIIGADLFKSLRGDSKRHIAEKIYYNTDLLLAGSADLSVIRKQNREKPWVLDIFDYKTNIEQGIRYDSIDRRKVPPKHYEQYYVGPFAHVEACNYFKYCMQLSVYAYMAMVRYNVRIGRLAIIFIDKDLKHKEIPVPFMYYEVQQLLNMRVNRKKLPEQQLKNTSLHNKERTEARVYEPLPSTPFDFYGDSEFETDYNN